MKRELLITATFLEGLADTLDTWARQSRSGGWSTHQVEPNMTRANDCRRRAAEIRAELARSS